MCRKLLVLEVLLLMVMGCGPGAQIPPMPPRPVSYVELQVSEPSAAMRLTGTAESWKREEIAFEVPGRVKRIVEPGNNIDGRTFDENGEPLSEGTVLAELDDERYRIALEQAEAGAEASRTELEQVIPQQLKEAQANYELQEKQLARYRAIRAENPGAASQQTIDQYEAEVKRATAQVAQVEAVKAAKAAELNTFLAQIDQAKRDIADCRLVSPFTGQIARIHVIPGGYAFRGIPVMTVQMMDPIKVEVAVSPSTDARIHQNDRVFIYTPSDEKLEGIVYLQDTFADPSTRTYLITLLVRNYLKEVGVPEDLEDESIPRCRNVWKLDRPDTQGEGNYFVDVQSLHEDEQGFYVWKAENLTVQQMTEDFSPVLQVRKVRVTPGEARVPVLKIFTFRELVDHGELDPATDIVVGEVSGDVEDGGQVILARKRWSLRPGDVVRVALKGEGAPEGYYVPEQAVQFDGGSHFVVIAQPGDDAHEATPVKILIHETVGDLQRIEPVDASQLAAGAKVVVDGAHYLQPGDAIRPVYQLDPTP